MPEQVLVTAVQHSDYYDSRAKVRFTPTVVRNAEGAQVYVAQAIVDEAVAKEFFADRPGIFKIELYTPAVVRPFEPTQPIKHPTADTVVDSKPVLDAEVGVAASAPAAPSSDPAAPPSIPTPDPKPGKKGK